MTHAEKAPGKGRIKRLVAVAIPVFLILAAIIFSLVVYDRSLLNEKAGLDIDETIAELERRQGEYDPQSIIMRNTSSSEANRLAEQLGAKLRITDDGSFATLTLPEETEILDVFKSGEYTNELTKMSADWQVRICEQDPEEGTDSGTYEHLPVRPRFDVPDSSYSKQTYLDYLNLADVWNSTKGAGITVAVIDTGIDTDHPEFEGRISPWSYNASEDKVVKDHNDWSLIKDENGHGTKVAGVLAADLGSGEIVGIAPEVTLLVIKAECDEDGNFRRVSDLIFGLLYAIERDVQVVNMSFAVATKKNIFAEVTQLAVDSDIICVASAGNDGTSAITYPAADPNVIGVGALVEDGWELADYSNYGDNIDLCAPGAVYTTVPGRGYGMAKGTSFASPMVAGAVALYLSNYFYVAVEYPDMLEVLQASSYDLGGQGVDWYYAYGALDISAAVIEEKGYITYDYMTDEIESDKQLFVRNHTRQGMSEPERLYAVFGGWYYDPECTEECNVMTDVFMSDLTLYASWANEDDTVPFEYRELEDGTIEIISYTGHRRYITVPDEIDGKPVSSIGACAFKEQLKLRRVLLPDTLKRISESAFADCANLLEMAIPASVEIIEDNAFYGDSRMSAVTFAKKSKLKSIETGAFAQTAIRIITIPESVSELNGTAFFSCRQLYQFSVEKGSRHFCAEDGILFNLSQSELVAYPAGKTGTRYQVPDSVRRIGEAAFAVSKIRAIDLNRAEELGALSFSGSLLTSVSLPDSVYSCGPRVFAYCNYLSSVSFGTGLLHIPEEMFIDCPVLSSVELPDCVLSIGTRAFANTELLQSFVISDNSQLVFIGEGAFSKSGLKSIRIPSAVQTIEKSAFLRCLALDSVTFIGQSQLEAIGDYAFYMCGFESFSLPEGLTFIGEEAFSGTMLKTVLIPAATSEIGYGAFSGCSQLTGIQIQSGNKAYVVTDGVLFTVDKKCLHTYPAGRETDSYDVPEGTEELLPYAFVGSYRLTQINLPDSLLSIGQMSLAYVGELRGIRIPDNVIDIRRLAFACDWNLEQIGFGTDSRLSRIGAETFMRCGITSFVVPKNVSSIGQYAFMSCWKLRDVTFAENSRLSAVPAYLFIGCSNLTSVTFAEGAQLTSLQAHGFEGLNNLTTIEFGNAPLSNIDNFAFRFCSNLQSFRIPDSVSHIGRYAFYECTSLSSLTMPAAVEFIGRFAFLGTNDCELYFESETLPSVLQDDWDHGLKDYYLGVSEVGSSGDFDFIRLRSGNIALSKYRGNEKQLDLRNLDLGGDIVIIAGKAFEYCLLESVILPDTLTTIQASAFARTKLQAVSIPASVSFIGKNAFAETPIRSLSFASGSRLTTIEQSAFEKTNNLSSVTIPKSVTQLGKYVFKSSGLSSLTFEEGICLEEVPKEAFAYTNLTGVAIPDSVTEIGYGAFREDAKLESVHLPEGNELRIRENAFYHTGLTSLRIPANVREIGPYAFVGLRKLNAFEVDEANTAFKSVSGLLLSSNGRKLIAAPGGKTGAIDIPEGVEVIGFGAFENSAAETVRFPKNCNILTIGCRAFFQAQNLKTITIPASVISIDYYAFGDCIRLHSVLFEEGCSLTGIYEGAFYGCESLQNISIPGNIFEIAEYAFYGCGKLDHWPIEKADTVIGIYDYAMAYAGLSGDLVIPETVTDIGNYAFMGTQIRSLTISTAHYENLMLGLGMLEDCNELEAVELPFFGRSYMDPEVSWFSYIFGAGTMPVEDVFLPSNANLEDHIPESLKKVHVAFTANIPFKRLFYGFADQLADVSVGYGPTALDGTFSWSQVLEHLSLPAGLTEVGGGALSGCTRLTSMILPDCLPEIPWGLFAGDKNLVSVTIPSHITAIRGAAFSGCESLQSVTIPDSVTVIEWDAFYGCKSLQSLDLPDGLTKIGEHAFMGCSSLKEIVIPDGVTELANYLFDDCSSLESVRFPSGVTEYGVGLFTGCKALTTIDLPDGMTEIPDNCFSYCTGLKSVRIPDTVHSIGSLAFAGCTSLLELTIPDGVEKIQPGTFEYCESIVELDLPEGFRTIEMCAFARMYGLRILTLPSTLTTIDECAFAGTSPVTIYNNSSLRFEFGSEENGAIAFGAMEIIEQDGTKRVRPIDPEEPEGNITEYITVDGVFMFARKGVYGDSDTYTLISYLGDEDTVLLPYDLFGQPYQINSLSGVKHVVFPDGWTEIPDSAFYCCPGLESATIPEGVTRIGAWAFTNCISLREVHIPSTVETIEYVAFAECVNLKNIVLPDGLKELGPDVFAGCASLDSLVIPASVEQIAGGAFARCSQLDLKIDEGNTHFVLMDRILYTSDLSQLVSALPTVSGIVTLPDTLTELPAGAFASCKKLAGIVLPDGLTRIGTGAFRQTELKSVVIPDSVEYIDFEAFWECENLVAVTMPKSLKVIGAYAFMDCVSLESVVLPNGIEEIGFGAFRNCKALETAVLPDSVTVLGGCAFDQCSSLRTIHIPAGVTTIWQDTFNGCTSLAEVDFAEGLKEIEHNAFEDCDSLKEIILPNSLTTLGCAFVRCPALEVLYIPDTVKDLLNGCPWYDSFGLRSVHIPEGVTDIDGWFGGQSELTDVHIPEGVVRVEHTFENCTRLKTVVLPSTVTDITSCFFGCSSLTDVTLPDTLTCIGERAFTDCTALTEIHIPDSVQILEDSVFYGCTSLRTVTGGSGVRKMGGDCFRSCYKLSSIVLSDHMKEISGQAFYDCYELYAIRLPASLETIGEAAFCNSGLREVEISGYMTDIGRWAFAGTRILLITNHSDLPLEFGSEEYGSLARDAIRIKEKDGTVLYANDSFEETPEGLVFSYEGDQYLLRAYVGSSDTVSLPLTYRNEPYELFDAYGFVNVELPNGMTILSGDAFRECKSLRSVRLPETLKEIRSSAFAGCTGLVSVELPNGLEKLGDSAFHSSGIRSITIPKSVQSIELWTFEFCSQLQSVNLQEGILQIASRAFHGCTSLTDIVLPDGLVLIEEEAFARCESLTKIRIPDSVVEIGARAFDDTGLYRDPDNWIHDCLFVDGWLAALGKKVKYPDRPDWMRGAVAGLAENNTVAKLSYHDSLRSGNVETVILTQKWIDSVESLTFIEEELIEFDLTGAVVRDDYVWHLPLSLKNIIISKDSKITNSDAFWKVSGVTIFVEADEKDLRWDENYPGWNNGNRVYYGDQWNFVRFYDKDGRLLYMGPYSTGQVIRRPIYPLGADERMEYRVEWDLDRDGSPDLIPATTTIPLSAKPIITPVEREYSLLFVNADGSVIEQQKLHYGDLIIAPSPGTRTGYEFFGYEGFVDGLTVTRDRIYTAVWQHIGGGHLYDVHHVEPGCDTEGYDEYVCSVCGESYRDHFTDALGHQFGDWALTKKATCTEDGEESRICGRCHLKETRAVSALGHDFCVSETVNATCDRKGSITYVCAQCGDTYTETTEMLPHHYKKTYAHWDFIQWLINAVYHAFTGRDLLSHYYYECDGCGKVMTKEEAFLAGIASAQGTCDHETAEWKDLFENCENGGLHAYVCDDCGKAIEAYILPPREHAFGEWTVRQEADPVNEGERFRICSVCGYEETETIPRTESLIRFVDWDEAVLSEKTYHYGDAVTLPADPVRPADETYTYTFTGWMPEIVPVSGDATYTATYKATPKTQETVEVKLDTANGGQNGETTILIPSDGKSTLSKITSTTASPDYLPGDVNGDGDIDGRDYIVVKKFVLGTVDFTERQQQIADINGDGEVDGIDYLLIKKHVLGTYTIAEPQPVEVPGPDYADFAVIIVNANGKVQSVKQADGKSKADLSVPAGGYAIAIPKSVLNANEALKNAIASLKAGDSVTLNGVSLNEQGIAVVLKKASILI